MLWSEKIHFAGLEWIVTITAWLRYKHNLLIGIPMGERILMDIGSAMPVHQERTMSIKGRNLITGLPDTLDISSIEVRSEIHSSVSGLVNRLKWFTGQFEYQHPQIPRIPDEFLQALRHTPIVIIGAYS